MIIYTACGIFDVVGAGFEGLMRGARRSGPLCRGFWPGLGWRGRRNLGWGLYRRAGGSRRFWEGSWGEGRGEHVSGEGFHGSWLRWLEDKTEWTQAGILSGVGMVRGCRV